MFCVKHISNLSLYQGWRTYSKRAQSVTLRRFPSHAAFTAVPKFLFRLPDQVLYIYIYIYICMLIWLRIWITFVARWYCVGNVSTQIGSGAKGWRDIYYCVQGRIKLFGAPRQWKHFRPLFQTVFLWGGGYYPPDWVKHHASQSQDRNNKYFILYIEFCINNKI